jgi:8-oxo-dGTP pyrophosphatase MutT (NUDIX family)
MSGSSTIPAGEGRSVVAPRPAATVLLIRDGADGLEVFLVQRHHQIDFAAGALVFPGGKLDPLDSDPALRALCAGADGLDDYGLSLRVAAIRESFEECGVLLARAKGSPALVSAARLADLWKRHRAEVESHRLAIGALARGEGLELACDLLVPFAHWITPEGMPKRFDTHFFLVEAPTHQAAVHDGHENVDARWLRPADALAEADAGRATIIFPTRMNLAKLGRSASVAEALAAARAARVVTVLPRVERGDGGPVLRIPAEAGYDLVEAPLESITRA